MSESVAHSFCRTDTRLHPLNAAGLPSPRCLRLPSGQAGARGLTAAAPQEPLNGLPGTAAGAEAGKPHGKGRLTVSRCKSPVGKEHLKATSKPGRGGEGEGDAAPRPPARAPPRPDSC